MANRPKRFFVTKRLPKTFQYTDYPPIENFEIFSALEPYYPVLDKIFDFLDCHELRKCCLVNESWKKLAERILLKRSYVTWFTYYKKKITDHRKFQFRTSDKFWYNNVGCVLILYNPMMMSLEHFSRYKVWQYVKAELIPDGVEHYTVSCPSVMSSFDPEIKDAMDHDMRSLIDGLFIPKIPNVKMIMCDISVDNVDQRIEPDDEVKCLLTFTTKGVKQYLSVLLDRLIPEESASSVAIGGGVIGGTNTVQKVSYQTHCLESNKKTFCIAFFKKKNVDADFDAYSIVIHSHLSLAAFEKKLFQFKQKITLREQAFGMRVCPKTNCRQDEESAVFNKIFSGIPSLGFAAFEEIGWNCFSSNETNDAQNEERKKHLYMDLVHHEWSTVFVLITWGQLKTV